MAPLVRALALGEFFRQRFDWCYALTFEPHAYKACQCEDVPQAAVRQTLRDFTQPMSGLLLDFLELVYEISCFVGHCAPDASGTAVATLWLLRA